MIYVYVTRPGAVDGSLYGPFKSSADAQVFLNEYANAFFGLIVRIIRTNEAINPDIV